MKLKIIFVTMFFCFGLVRANPNDVMNNINQELLHQLKDLISVEQQGEMTEQAEEALLEDLLIAGFSIAYVCVFKYVFENAHRTDYDAEEWMPYFDW